MPGTDQTIMTWTTPYHGVSHCGEHTDHRRATINIYARFTILHCYTREVKEGHVVHTCMESTHITPDEARSAGEQFIQTGNLPPDTGKL